MKHITKLLAAWLILSAAAWAQFTTVTGTVIDPNGIPYANGTITAQLVTAGVTPTINGGSFSMAGSAGLDINGSFTIRLADNAVMSPNTLKWRFTVCSARGTVNPAIGTGSQCFTPADITITGSTQSITTQLHAAALALTIAGSTSGLTGTLTPPHIPVATAAHVLGDSSLQDDGTQVTTPELGGFGPLANPSATLDTGSAQNYTGSKAFLDGSGTCTNTANTTFCEAGHNFVNWDPVSAVSGATAIASLNYATVPSSNSTAIGGTLVGNETESDFYGTGGITNNWARWTGAAVESASGTIANNAGEQIRAILGSLSGATITQNAAVNAVTVNLSTTGHIVNDYIYKAAEFESFDSPVDHHYAVWVGSQNSAGGANNPDPWGFYEQASTERNRLGPITQDQGITTAGLTHAIQVGRVALTGQTSGIGTTTLYTTGAANTDYLVTVTTYCTATSASATVAPTITYTGPGSETQTITPPAADCTVLGSSSFNLINSPLVAKAGTNIQYSAAIANTPTYSLRIDLYQLGSN